MTSWNMWIVIFVAYSVGYVNAQAEGVCYGAGAIATSVILSVICTLLVLGLGYYWWNKRRNKTEHLILETDPEKGKGQYAFDNPGFKDAGLSPISKPLDKTPSKYEYPKQNIWSNWSALSALTTRFEKRKTLDDSVIEGNEIKVVSLKSHDFTGLGFSICGNMKEGIYIKDVLHRGPALESGKLNAGDRINSVTISFEHMVYEDALTILSYASPYEIIIEAKGGKLLQNTPKLGGQPSHPMYRSSSCTDLQQIEKSKKRPLGEEYSSPLSSTSSSLYKSRSNMTTLERKESTSPKGTHIGIKKSQLKNNLSSEQLKTQLEQKIMADRDVYIQQKADKPIRIESEVQKTENKHHKFGIKVLPFSHPQSPKSSEQNDNNINIERKEIEYRGIDEVDDNQGVPLAKKRERKPDIIDSSFSRNTTLNDSGIKRDENGIPQEMPAHMLNAAVAARKNRKSSKEVNEKLEEEQKATKKTKGKAPAPPEEKGKEEKSTKNSFDEIQSIEDIPQYSEKQNKVKLVEIEKELLTKEEIKDYNSDSDVEDNQSSVNTIELNSSDITIHHEENEDKQNRKTLSTGDLSKIHKTRKVSSGTLERAQSLDITDAGMPSLNKKRKGGRIDDTFDTMSDEDIFGKAMLNKEPRLSLILDGLNTFQRNRLKKSTEWGNLEDAILNSSQEDTNSSFDQSLDLENASFDFGEKSDELNALVNKIKEIRRESQDVHAPIELEHVENKEVQKNEIWPSLKPGVVNIVEIKPPVIDVQESKPKLNVIAPVVDKSVVNTIWPEELDIDRPKYNMSPIELQCVRATFTKAHETELEDKKASKLDGIVLNGQGPDVEYPKRPVTIEKVKYKRQQIPNNQERTFPPPEGIFPPLERIVSPPEAIPVPPAEDLTLEKEIFDELSRLKEDDPIVPEIKERKSLIPEKIKRQSIPRVVTTVEEAIDTCKRCDPNPETGEPCSIAQEDLSQSKADEHFDAPKYFEHVDVTETFLINERLSNTEEAVPGLKTEDTNISDDIKVSRHSLKSLESKSDDAKSVETLHQGVNVSNVVVTNNQETTSPYHSLEFTINDPNDEGDYDEAVENNELYTTALDNTAKVGKDVGIVTISTPDLIKNVTITEAINTLNSEGPLLTLDLTNDGTNRRTFEIGSSTSFKNTMPVDRKLHDNSGKNSSLTYITEIQVTTPTNGTNVSEVKIPDGGMKEKVLGKNLDNGFENYVKNFETNIKHFENNIQNYEKKLGEINSKEVADDAVVDKIESAEKQFHKIQELAEEQLKKLPEMRFTTSSYEAPKIPEKRQSQIEILRSNFEKSPPRVSKTEISPKSRIPVATPTKTPPTSPERRDSKNLENENDREILELMSNVVHSTPLNSLKSQQKSPPNKNVTVTSIRTNSRIPSGVATFGKPPIPSRKSETNDDTIIQTGSNGNVSSFKQWVFDPVDNTVSCIPQPGYRSDQK